MLVWALAKASVWDERRGESVSPFTDAFLRVRTTARRAISPSAWLTGDTVKPLMLGPKSQDSLHAGRKREGPWQAAIDLSA